MVNCYLPLVTMSNDVKIKPFVERQNILHENNYEWYIESSMYIPTVI